MDISANSSDLEEDDQDAFLENNKRKRRSRRCSHWPYRQIHWNIITSILLAVILALQIFDSIKSPIACKSSQGQQKTTAEAVLHDMAMRGVECGSTAKEAEERGCIFDLMRIAWTPKECFHASLAEDSQAEGPFPWYRGLEGTDPITPEQLKYEEKALTSWGYHISHCRYVLALAELGNQTDLLVPGDIASFSHMAHCGSFLGQKNVNASALGPVAIVRTSFCIRLKDYQ